jgi:hypothetical protein
MNQKLSLAIATILSATSYGVRAAAPATDSSDADSGALQEIIVTAQHRNEGMQNVPIAMQAFTEAEAGVIRYITNQPKLDKTEANVTASYSEVAHGDPNTKRDGGAESAVDSGQDGGARRHL